MLFSILVSLALASDVPSFMPSCMVSVKYIDPVTRMEKNEYSFVTLPEQLNGEVMSIVTGEPPNYLFYNPGWHYFEVDARTALSYMESCEANKKSEYGTTCISVKADTLHAIQSTEENGRALFQVHTTLRHTPFRLHRPADCDTFRTRMSGHAVQPIPATSSVQFTQAMTEQTIWESQEMVGKLIYALLNESIGADEPRVRDALHHANNLKNALRDLTS